MTESIHIKTNDGRLLAGTWFMPEDSQPHTALLVNSGTAIPRDFYRRFAAFAASMGFGVLTYDYRGSGDSAPENLAESDVVYRDWGHLDIPAAITWIRERLPGIPLAVAAHSTGGQQLGLAHNVDAVDAALFVAVSTGYWKGMPTKEKYFTWTLWNLVVPATRIFPGYFPAKRLGLGEDIPAGVAAEWGAWCLQPEYMAAFFDDTGRLPCPDGRPFGPIYFDKSTHPIVCYCFTDDYIASRDNVPPMMDLFTETYPDIRWHEPSDLGVDEIGHLGFFRGRIGKPLWGEALEELRESAAKTYASRDALATDEQAG